MTLRRIEKNLSDVNHTFKELQEFIWKNYDFK